jgi:phosphopantetheine adenylyltransferase
MAKFCKELDINFSIRGVRSVKDYEYELQLQEINEVINSDLTTIYLFPPAKYAGLSSSLVKGLVGNDGWEEIVKNMVPENVLKELDKLRK